MPNKYVNIAIEPKTREKIRLIAAKNNAKISQLVDAAVMDYAKKNLTKISALDRKVLEA